MQKLKAGLGQRTAARPLCVAVCFLALALGGCDRSDRGATTDTARSAAGGRSSPRLTKPIGSYTAAEFQEVVGGLYFGGSDVEGDPAADTSIADSAMAGAVMIIEAMSEANDVSLADPGANGTVVARLRNLRGRDNTFGTRPGAAFEYYVIVEPGEAAGSAAFQIVELTRAQSPTRPPSRVSGGTISRCDPNESAPAYSSARFGGCEHGATAAATERTSFLGVKTAWALAGGSAWVSCREGCCELTMATTLQQ